jgi:phospholipase D1/2
MSALTQRAMQHPGTLRAARAIVQPGRNCWRVERADRFYCIQDAADYFRLVRQALCDARDTVFITGWDIASTIDLAPGLDATEAPTRLDELIAFIAKRRPHLQIYILIWDYGSLYTLEREPLTRWRLGWRTPRRVHFGFDDHHPVGASHHQKIVVVDDRLAFCGGIDLTGHRWDTAEHRIEEPARKTIMGLPYGPYHEVQAMVSGPAAASLGVLSRDRWRSLGYEQLPPIVTPSSAAWPSDVVPDLIDVNVAISRTVPASEMHPAIRECEALFHDSIARADRLIYIESQYFTEETLAGALAERLRERDGPEVVIVAPKECYGWLERQTMGAFRDSAFRQLKDADRHSRLRLVYPLASRSHEVPTFVHSKVMIVDDELLRIGSANFARRSMGMDTECDLAVEAGGDPNTRAGIRRIRNRLIAEHLGLAEEAVEHELQRAGSLRALIDVRQSADRALVPIELVTDDAAEPSPAIRAATDPGEPIGFGSTVTQLVPRIDATGGSPLRIWILPAIALLAAVVMSDAINTRPEFQAVRDALEGTSSLRAAVAVGTGAFVIAGLLLVPLELLTIVAAVALGARRGGIVAAIGTLALALTGYAAGRAMGPPGVARWVSRRSYRSVAQLGARGVIGMIVLRLSSIASTGAIHLLCGAGRVAMIPYVVGTILGMTPAIVALSILGGLLRDTLIRPSLSTALMTVGVAVLLLVVAGAVRTLLLIRQFAPSVAMHRDRAQFG